MGHTEGSKRKEKKREEKRRKVEHWIGADKGRVIVIYQPQ